MTYKTRKRIWPLALMSLAIAGALAVVVALSMGPPQSVSAHVCDNETMTFSEFIDCQTTHVRDGEDHDQNSAPVTTAPVMMPIEIVGVMVPDAAGNMVNNTQTVSGVGATFSDADGDELTFTVGSDNTGVATGMLDADGNLVITAMDAAADPVTITVTAADGNGGEAKSTIEVTVLLSAAERFDLWHAADPNKRARLVEFEAPAEERVTFTVSAKSATGGKLTEDATVNLLLTQYPMGAPEPLVARVIGLDSSLDNDITDDDILQGLLTVRATDPKGERGFTIYFQCTLPGQYLVIEMYDETPDEVDRARIQCEAAPEPPPPPDRTDVSDTYTVASYDDWMYHDATDGYIVTDLAGNPHEVNMMNVVNGWLERDEPVIHAVYTLGVSEVELLDDMDNGNPRRPAATEERRVRNADVEEGQRTVEVLVGAPHVQLTVTSRESGPTYIRFMDSDMMAFGTDVDEEPMWRGADVVGLDSQGRLNLNREVGLTKAKALAYDQYEIVTPGIVPGQRAENSHLEGVDGDYNQGTFRFFNPCPREMGAGHHFYVEVYEKDGKYLETTEKIVCIDPPGVTPSELAVTTYSDRPGEATLGWRGAIGATYHHVIVLDMTNPMRPLPVAGSYSRVPAQSGGAYDLLITGLMEGVEYRFAVAAERRDAAGGITYSMPSYIDQIMDWE